MAFRPLAALTYDAEAQPASTVPVLDVSALPTAPDLTFATSKVANIVQLGYLKGVSAEKRLSNAIGVIEKYVEDYPDAESRAQLWLRFREAAGPEVWPSKPRWLNKEARAGLNPAAFIAVHYELELRGGAGRAEITRRDPALAHAYATHIRRFPNDALWPETDLKRKRRTHTDLTPEEALKLREENLAAKRARRVAHVYSEPRN